MGERSGEIFSDQGHEGSGELEDLLEAAAAGQNTANLPEETSRELGELRSVLGGEEARSDDSRGDEVFDDMLPDLSPPEEQPGRKNVRLRTTSWHAQTKDGIQVFRSERWASILDEENSAPLTLQAAPVEIHPVTITTAEASDGETETIGIVPDVQISYRLFEDGTEQATHSEEAMDVCLQILQDIQPLKIVVIGDLVDFTELSKHPYDPPFQGGLNSSINRAHQFLAQMRANCPGSEIIYFAGNHEERMEKYLFKQAREIAGLRRAGSNQRSLSVPELLNLEAIGNIQYVAGYPAGTYWVSNDVRVIHGHVVRQGSASTVAALLRSANNSIICGHGHRLESGWATQQTRDGGRSVVAAMVGTLSDISGRVPSYGSSVDENYQPVPHIENWQNGMGIVEIWKQTGRIACMDLVFMDTFNPVNPYVTRYRGTSYIPSRKQAEAEVL